MSLDLIPILLVFLLVGVIVSLDVAGLTLSKSEELSNDERSVFGWAFFNACWHAGLLWVYILVISGVFSFSLEFLDWLEGILLVLFEYFQFIDVDLKAYLDVLFGLLRQHAKLLLGIVTLYIVWHTYSGKIVGEPVLGNRDELPPLAKAVYGLIELISRFPPFPFVKFEVTRVTRSLQWHAQAALVAVDMLALAALMKAMGYLETRILQFSLIVVVLAVVFVAAWYAGNKGRELFQRIQNVQSSTTPHEINMQKWVIITLRLLEPLFIFYFVLELVGFLLFEQQIHTIGFLFGAALLLCGLVNKHSLSTIVAKALSPSVKRNNPTNEGPRNPKEIFGDFVDLLRLAGIVVLVVSGAILALFLFVIFFYTDPKNFISLDAEISRIVGTVSFIVAFIVAFAFFFIPKTIKTKFARICITIMENRHTYMFILGALFVAAILPVYEEITGDLFSGQHQFKYEGLCKIIDLGVGVNHIHAVQVALWLVYLSLIGTLFELAERKYNIISKKLLEQSVTNSHFPTIFYTSLLIVSGIAFLIISRAQEWLRVAFDPCFGS